MRLATINLKYLYEISNNQFKIQLNTGKVNFQGTRKMVRLNECSI